MEPKFKIGDHVVFRGTLGRKKFFRFPFTKDAEKELQDVPAQMFRVTDTLIETCYGGTQIHYTLRPLGVGSDGLSYDDRVVGVVKDLFKAREIELEISPVQ